MTATIEFTPASKEKWAKYLLSVDPSEKKTAMTVLKVAAKHNGLRSIQAYMSKTADEKAEIIWAYQQEENPYKANGAAAKATEAEVEDTEEEQKAAPEKGHRKVRRRKRRGSAEASEAAAPDSEETESKPESATTAGAAAVSLGPISADLSTIKEMLAASEARQETLSEMLEKVIGRLSEIDKWVKEAHCVIRVFALSQEGAYDNLTNPDIIEELYGKSAFDELSEGNE